MSKVSLKVHRVRFFNPQLSSINSVSFDETTQLLAVMRRRIYKYKGRSSASGRIEIWNFKHKSPFIEQIINDDDNNPSLLEAIIWGKNGRLFSCGLNAYINEYDLIKSSIKKSYAVTSGPAWTLDMNYDRTLVAVGTEEGYICVFTIDDDGLVLDKTLDRHEKRILCVKWYQSNLVIGGSIGYIKIWNYYNGQCIDYINVGIDVVIWCLSVLKDFTIISGDSKGFTTFWNGNTATMEFTHQSHKADVLCICVNPKESIVYTSSVDPIIAQFSLSSNNKSIRWAKTLDHRLHTHDVRALTYVKPNWLISGGIDSYLVKSSHSNNLQLPYTENFSSKIHIDNDRVLFQYDYKIEIWKLGKEKENIINPIVKGNPLPLNHVPNKLIELISKSFILASAFSLHWIGYATVNGLKILFLDENELKKVPILYEPIMNAYQMIIIDDKFMAVNCGNIIYILRLDLMGIILEKRLDYDYRIYSIVSSNKFVAIFMADLKNSVMIYDSNWNVITQFTVFSLPNSIAFNPFNDSGEIYMSFSDHQIIQYSIKDKLIKKSFNMRECVSKNVNLPLDEYWCINQIAFTNGAVLLSDDNLLYKYDILSSEITKCDKYRHIVKLGNTIVNNEIIIVELTREMLYSKLPAALAKKKFGT